MSATNHAIAHPAPTKPTRPELEGLPKRGDVFDGKYRIEGVLGVGGMGAVFAAMHLRLDERVAIKLLLPESMDNPQLVERFMSEGRMTSKIRSEHVARVMDFGSFLGRPYLVLEYLAGKDFGALLEEVGPLAVPSAVDFVLQACEAIAEAHTHGVIHRDLKPSNLFLVHRSDGSPCVKVLDFGISKILRAPDRASGCRTPRTLASEVIGSPHYMPPEQLESATNADERSDIWALGAILHELLAGHPPFQAESITALCATILRDPPASLVEARTDVPPALNAVVRRCLEKDPSNRFANIAELASALASFGSAAAVTSAETIVKILEGGTEPNGIQSLRHLTPKPEYLARQARASALPATPMRSAAPGYVLGGALLVALFAFGGWELFTQGHRIRDAEARTESAHAAPAFVIPAVPGAGAVAVPATPSAPVAQVTTTSGALSTDVAHHAVAPPAPPAATPPAATVVAVAQAPATPPPAPVHVHHHHAARRAEPTAASESALPSGDDNPYGTARLTPAAPPVDPAPPPPSPPVAVTAAPADTSQLFEERK